jgi:hypothetical protein
MSAINTNSGNVRGTVIVCSVKSLVSNIQSPGINRELDKLNNNTN